VRYVDDFAVLGDFLYQFLPEQNDRRKPPEKINRLHHDGFAALIEDVHLHNPWFTPEFVLKSISGLCVMLLRENLIQWIDLYPDLKKRKSECKNVGVVMAGNIPLVGFHDMISVLHAGHHLVAKPSSKDEHLIKAVADILIAINPVFQQKITFRENLRGGIDAVIATGSDNTSRYFNYYFRDIPRIIRKNRNSIAVLTGKETDEQIMDLGKDIFTYFGLGCRNVTKIFVPEEFDLNRMLRLFESFTYLYNHHKYANNIDYYRTVYLINREPFFDNGALLIKMDKGFSSPVGVVFYENYSQIESVLKVIDSNRDLLQCIVSLDSRIEGAIPPGSTQEPLPWDYADGVDTIKFLTDI
jgi:hypothetical protein